MKGAIANLIIVFLSLGIGVYCFYALYQSYGNQPLYLLYGLGLLVSFPLTGLLHEFGHVVFGFFAKIKAVPRLSFFNSSCCKIIPKTDKNLKARIAVTTVGGLAVNFLFIVLGVVALFVPAVPVEIAICVLPASFYYFALNALPLNLSEGKTDGLVIAELIKNEDSAKVMLAVLTVQAQVLAGKPIEAVDEKLLFDLPQLPEDDFNFISLTQFRYEYFKAKGDAENAERYLSRYEDLKKYL